jgi:lysine 6-dehydrogenase
VAILKSDLKQTVKGNLIGMRVVFFGGLGDMGQSVVRELCKFPEIEQVTMASRNKEKFERFKKQVQSGRGKLSFLAVDLDRCENLSENFKGYNLVAGAAGPFYKYERMLAAAAIEAGADYVSICDDYDAVAQVFELDEIATERGLRVLTGIGWTPGLSSLLARAAADSLETVEKINVAWAASSEDTMGMAVILHVLHAYSGRIPSFQEGSLRLIPAVSGKERIRFPEPIGEINVYHVGHPEPVTMPRYFPGISEVTLKGGINEDMLNKLALIVGKTGLCGWKTSRELIAAFFHKTLSFWRKAAGPAPDATGIRVDVEGLYKGESCRLTYSAAGPMDVLTGMPMAIAIRELARGKIEKTGVFAPEAPGALDPRIFFDELEIRGVKIIKEGHDAMSSSGLRISVS